MFSSLTTDFGGTCGKSGLAPAVDLRYSCTAKLLHRNKPRGSDDG